MTVEEFHKGDIGIAIEITITKDGIAEDISLASKKYIKIGRPDGTSINGLAVFVTDGTDGKIEYVTVADDLDQDGVYTFQPYIEIGLFKGHAERVASKIYGNVSDTVPT
jgi:hypothetical protein